MKIGYGLKEFVIKLNYFRSIYRFFWIKIAVEWSKNIYNLIIAIGFNFYVITVIYSLNCCDQSITIRLSQDFKSDCLDISPIYHRYIFDISPIFYQKIKLTYVCIIDPIFL